METVRVFGSLTPTIYTECFPPFLPPLSMSILLVSMHIIHAYWRVASQGYDHQVKLTNHYRTTYICTYERIRRYSSTVPQSLSQVETQSVSRMPPHDISSGRGLGAEPCPFWVHKECATLIFYILISL